ncbi:MAG: tRNA (guanosine(46)-N7)-methyltransferase TrmB [Burkholderiales bacterium]|nr:tRNA (guanosine(46)-N7)-methyltransferase TrmB [Anaerolineae bacterium]
MRKLNSSSLPWPTDWAELFGTARPLILEIGFGGGTFLLHLARQNPDANVIGLEIANRSLVRGEAAIERSRLTNVRAVHSMAETALHHLFTPASLSQIHINFPDPWFKRKHEGRRLMQRDTLNTMVNRLAPGGTLYLATDIIDYAEMSAALLADTPQLENTLDAAWVNAMTGRIVTKYELIAHLEGRKRYFFAYRRNAVPAPYIPVIEDLPMPHIVFHSPLELDAVFNQFADQDYAPDSDDTYISMMYVYRAPKVILFEVFVKEPTIEQRFAFLLMERFTDDDQRKPDEYTLRLSSLGHPRTTAGVHRAAALLSDWLLSLHPDTHVLEHKILNYAPEKLKTGE